LPSMEPLFPSLPHGTVSCLLCRGTISLRTGDLAKFRSHLETVHESVYSHDLLIAITFLEESEKEVIMEKVMPRIKSLFTNIKHKTEYPFKGKLSLEKLLEDDTDVPEIVYKSNLAKAEAVLYDDATVAETNLVEIGEGFEYNEIADQEEDHVQETEQGPSEKGRAVKCKCKICGKVMKKFSLSRHMRRQHSSAIGSVKSTGKVSSEKTSIKSRQSFIADNVPSGCLRCELCGKVMLKSSISRHIRKAHAKRSSAQTEKMQSSENGDALMKKMSDLVTSTSSEINNIENAVDTSDCENTGKEITYSKINPEELIREITAFKEESKHDQYINEEMPVMSVNPFECEKCEKVFSSKRNVRRHKSNVHNELNG